MSDKTGISGDESSVRRWQAPVHSIGGHAGSGPLTASRLAEIEEQAYAQGFERGIAAGKAEGKRQAEECVRQLEHLFAAIKPECALLDEGLLRQIGDLIFAITRQMIRRELETKPGEVVAVVREALDVLPVTETEIRILLHPDDAAIVTGALKPETVSHPIRILEDVSLSRGGARVETDVSVVDATIEARIGAIAASIFGDDRSIEEGSRDDA